jgi:2-oxoglutarate ferredoxin oxidoreductase subunit beta
MNCVERYDAFEPQWCPGCGNFTLLDALLQAMADLELPVTDYIMITGIGQASKLGFSVNVNLFDGLHGRVLPTVLGVSLANHKARVIAVAGDGGFYAEGGNHLLHNARRNVNVTVLASDNRVYGLTKGQASPTSAADFVTKVHPEGTGSQPFNPTAVALAAGATFVSRAFTGNKEQLTSIIKQAIEHKGFSMVDILSPCISFNKTNTFAWFKERAKPVGPEHDPSDIEAAWKLAVQREETLPTGVLYRVERPVFGSHLTALRGDPIAKRTLGYTPERVLPLLDRFE